jgi:hypothetical protein
MDETDYKIDVLLPGPLPYLTSVEDTKTLSLFREGEFAQGKHLFEVDFIFLSTFRFGFVWAIVIAFCLLLLLTHFFCYCRFPLKIRLLDAFVWSSISQLAQCWVIRHFNWRNWMHVICLTHQKLVNNDWMHVIHIKNYFLWSIKFIILPFSQKRIHQFFLLQHNTKMKWKNW